MSVKILSVVLMMSLSLTFNGCAEKQYITKTKEVYIPTKCIVPEVKCDIQNNTYTEIVQDLVQCIVKHKEARKVCE